MKSFVITLVNNPASVELAQRCIATGIEHGVNVQRFIATTRDESHDVLVNAGLRADSFTCWMPDVRQSVAAAKGCLASHYRLWQQCAEDNEPYLVMEHDAFLTSRIPSVFDSNDYGIVHVGVSYGNWGNYTPASGINPIRHSHLRGCHGYILSTHQAQYLVKHTQTLDLLPVDVLLSPANFSGLQEYGPPFVSCDGGGTFSSIRID